MADAAAKPMTLDEFLIWEERQPDRYEFADGQVLMMAGGTDQHDEVRCAIYAALRVQLAGKPCRARLDLKIVCPNGQSRYPDLAVDCGPRSAHMTQLAAPTIVVEVLSPSTHSTDYVVKARDYASVGTIEIYFIVDPDAHRVDVLRCTPEGCVPDPQIEDRDAIIDLPMIGARRGLADIYQT
jgi:Uma2 family endonuclease